MISEPALGFAVVRVCSLAFGLVSVRELDGSVLSSPPKKKKKQTTGDNGMKFPRGGFSCRAGGSGVGPSPPVEEPLVRSSTKCCSLTPNPQVDALLEDRAEAGSKGCVCWLLCPFCLEFPRLQVPDWGSAVSSPTADGS